MRKINAVIFLLIVSLFALSAFAETTDKSNLELQLEARYANLERIAKPLDVTATAMKEYISDINGDASNLNAIHVAFSEKVSKIREQKTHIELNELIVEAGEDIKAFAEEYKAQFNANNGRPLVSLAKILEALKGEKTEIDELTEEFWIVRKTNVMQIFDNDIGAGEKLLPLFEKHKNYDEIAAKLNEIKEMRSSLEQALESRKELQILDVQTDIALKVQELRELIKAK